MPSYPVRSCVVFFLLLASAAAFAAAAPADLLEQGRANDAISELRKQLNDSPNNVAAHNLLCRVLYREERWDQAVNECEKAASLAGDNSLYQLWLGRSYGKKAEHSSFITAAGLAGKIRNAFERAVALNPKSAEARSDLSEFYIEAPGFMGGGLDKAEAQAAELDKIDPANASWVRARIAEKRERKADAEAAYKEELERSKHATRAQIDLASYYRRAERYDDVERVVSAAVAADPEPDVDFFDAATLLFRAGRNFPLAISLLEKYTSGKYLSEDAPQFQALYLLGYLREKQGDNAGALAAYRASAALATDYAPAKAALKRLQK